MNKKKTSLFCSVISLLLCVSMLAGTTFAWFTDSVTSGVNTIAAGNLDVELEYLVDGQWKPVTESTNIFDNDALWEPGFTQVAYLRVVNAGSLALKYDLSMNVLNEIASVNMAGERFVLSDFIEFGVITGITTPYATREEARAAVTSTGILSSGFAYQGAMEAGAEPQTMAIVVYMPESVDNRANHRNDVDPPHIELGIKLFATQEVAELDSFGSDYDTEASLPLGNLHVNVQAPVAAELISAEHTLTEAVTVGSTEGEIFAEVPADVMMADGATALTLTVNTMETSQANVTLVEGEEATPIDVHIDGISADNAVPMQITLKGLFAPGLNDGNYKLYHVENGITQEMICVANPVGHNEFSYDAATGDVVMALKSFSEVLVVSNAKNYWNGQSANGFAGGSGTENDPYQIATAGQLAYFRDLVDGGKSFAGEYVKLTANICLASDPTKGEPISFDPIGWGYVNSSWNRDADGDGNRDAGKVFQGTFDGGNNYIFGLYQNGWDLEASTGTVYTYTNCGFGLFAAAYNATFKDLTITGANIKVECVEAGVLVGLSQGNCEYNNIKIYGCKVANYQRPAGGVVGEVSPAFDANGDVVENTHTFTNVIVDNKTVVGSLWGDFDAPLGGVIGAYWDDTGMTKVNMKGCHVGCVIDAYSDVTSAYQWYAYRRAGMLIGNSDRSKKEDSGRTVATADYLTCEDVHIYYGDWINYHYCEFTDQDNTWCNNYPWVRVEQGENCSAYSNPRYGVPVRDGKKVDAATHNANDHTNGDECHITIPFGQLYGGGQGVYGGGQEVKDHYDDYVNYETNHDGVVIEGRNYIITMMSDNYVVNLMVLTDGTAAPDFNGKDFNTYKLQGDEGRVFAGWLDETGKPVTAETFGNLKENVTIYANWADYTVTYMDREQVYAVVGVNKGDTYKIGYYKDGSKIPNPTREETGVTFKEWVNAARNPVDTVTVDGDIVVYDSWNGIYTVTFLHHTGRVLKEQEFTQATAGQVTAPTVNNWYHSGDPTPFVPYWGYYDGDTWKTDWQNMLKSATSDKTIVMAYNYGGDLGLVPVDTSSPKDGVVEYYKVIPTNDIQRASITIPGEIDGVTVTTIQRVHNESGGWRENNTSITTITVEEGVTTIGHNGLAFTPNLKTVYLPSTITSLGKNAFCRNGGDDNNKEIDIYFNGTRAMWDAILKNSPNGGTGDYWAGGLDGVSLFDGEGTRVYCKDKVDGNYIGYYERSSDTFRTWEWHSL